MNHEYFHCQSLTLPLNHAAQRKDSSSSSCDLPSQLSKVDTPVEYWIGFKLNKNSTHLIVRQLPSQLFKEDKHNCLIIRFLFRFYSESAFVKLNKNINKTHSSYQSQLPQPAVVYIFQAGVLFSSENARGTALNKVYPENINTNRSSRFYENTRYTIPSSECSILCKKYTIPMQNTPSTPTKTANTPNIDLRRFVALKFLSKIYALYGVQFPFLLRTSLIT